MNTSTNKAIRGAVCLLCVVCMAAALCGCSGISESGDISLGVKSNSVSSTGLVLEIYNNGSVPATYSDEATLYKKENGSYKRVDFDAEDDSAVVLTAVANTKSQIAVSFPQALEPGEYKLEKSFTVVGKTYTAEVEFTVVS